MSRASHRRGNGVHHRRGRKRLVSWIPVLLAGLLIVAAFFIAPSLQAPAPRSAPSPAAALPTQSGRPPADQVGMPATSGRVPGPEGKAAPSDAGVGQLARSGERREPSTPETSKPAKRARAPRPARAASEPHDDASAEDLSVRWNQ
jgi:hypothetical protein